LRSLLPLERTRSENQLRTTEEGLLHDKERDSSEETMSGTSDEEMPLR
jgi:hypothetical protein